MRTSGILLPISSLPTKYGIGGFSKEAYEFVDRLKAAGQKNWQILPLGPTGYGDSPYQSVSTFAGNPYFISLDTLMEESLLTEEECQAADCGDDPNSVNYERVYHTRYIVLEKAFQRFAERKENEDALYLRFLAENNDWLENFCLYAAIKEKLQGLSWQEWPEDLRNREARALENMKEELAAEMDFIRFLQFEFWKQWHELKVYANDKGIRIIGDVPIYVAMDSADTWANPEMFQFDEDGKPTGVAGCPPDAFAVTGQLWGNPLYDWSYHKNTGYQWWIRRMSHCFYLYDIVRVDHFRGFDEYYNIPYGDPTAEFGHWEKGPGIDLFDALKAHFGEMNIIAEDLGFVTDSVRDLVKNVGLPGMKVVEFGFGYEPEYEYLPHYYTQNSIAYTGTHDNETFAGWWNNQSQIRKDFLQKYMGDQGADDDQTRWDFIRMTMSTVSDTVIIPMQDYLGLGNEARINEPSTLGNNWKWRMKEDAFTPELIERIRDLTKTYDR